MDGCREYKWILFTFNDLFPIFVSRPEKRNDAVCHGNKMGYYNDEGNRACDLFLYIRLVPNTGCKLGFRWFVEHRERDHLNCKYKKQIDSLEIVCL